MIDAVLLFGALNVLFEFVVLSMISPRLRLRLLGNPSAQVLVHFGMLVLNLAVHWGTLVGTMASVLAFVCSIATIAVAKRVWGTLVDGRYYTTGFIRYSTKELL